MLQLAEERELEQPELPVKLGLVSPSSRVLTSSLPSNLCRAGIAQGTVGGATRSACDVTSSTTQFGSNHERAGSTKKRKQLTIVSCLISSLIELGSLCSGAFNCAVRVERDCNYAITAEVKSAIILVRPRSILRLYSYGKDQFWNIAQ